MDPIFLAIILALPCCFLCGCGTSGPKVEATFQHVMSIQCLAFSADGKYLAAGSKGVSQKAGEFWEGRVLVWEVATQKPVASLDQPNWANSIAFSPDGKLLAVGNGSANVYNSREPNYHGFVKKPGEIRVYEVGTWKEMFQKQDGDMVLMVEFSSDSKVLGSSSVSYLPNQAILSLGVVTVWEAGTGKEKFKVPEIKSHWPSISFDPKTGHLVIGDTAKSGVGDGRIRIFDPQNGKMKREFSVPEMSFPKFLAVSPDGKMLAGLSNNGPVVLWDLQTGKNITPANLTKEFVKTAPAVAFSLIAGFSQG